MPIYEYKCDECGGVFERIQKFADAPLTTHEACGGAVHRLVSLSAIQFKGSGWYITDYGRGGSKPDGGKSDSGKSDSAGKSDGEGKSDSGGKSETNGKGNESSKTESTKSETKSESKPSTTDSGSSSKTSTSKTE